jgi:hypothetical protein
MELFLVAACVALFGLAVAAFAFGATADSDAPPTAKPQLVVFRADTPARFFVDSAPLASRMGTQPPIEALLLQIEDHVRLEQAAAESFLESPTPALLHSPTVSALANGRNAAK